MDSGIFTSSVFMAERYFLYPTADCESLVVWDMERQHVLGQLEGHDEVEVVAARGSLAVSCQSDGPVRHRVWNLETMQCTATLPVGEDDAATSSACCMDGKLLLGEEDGIVKVWEVAASAPIALANLEGHTSEVRAVNATAAGSMVLSGSDDTTVRLWDLRTGSRCVRTMEGHTHGIISVDMDGHCRTAISSARDKTIKLWDLGTGLCTEVYNGHSDGSIRDVVMHESGSSFLSYGQSGQIVNAWAVGSTRATMRAAMESSHVPNTTFSRLFACTGLSTVAFCSISPSQMRFSVWR